VRVFTTTAADVQMFQHVAIRHLEDRVTRALQWCRADELLPDLDSLVVCGGVAANQQVRMRLLALAEKLEIRAVFPPGKPSPFRAGALVLCGVASLGQKQASVRKLTLRGVQRGFVRTTESW